MATINMSSIMNKVNAYGRSANGKLKMKECIDKYVEKGVRKTAAGDRVITETDMWTAATKLIKVLQDTARSHSLPSSVMEHFDKLECSKIYEMPDGSSVIYVYFGDDLHRDSLMPQKYGGVDNIVALINNGYDEHPNMEKVWGEWHDVRIHALSKRTGLHFIQQAIQDFNGNYGADYNVTAVAGDDYE